MFTNKYPQSWVNRFKSDSEMNTYCKNKEEAHQCLYKDCTNDSGKNPMCKAHQKAITDIVNQIINFFKSNFETWLLDWSYQALKDKSLYPTRLCQDMESEIFLEYAGDNDLLYQYFILNFGEYVLEDSEQVAYDCVTFETNEQKACIYEILDRPSNLDRSDNNSYTKFLIHAMLHRKALENLTLEFVKPMNTERTLERLIKLYREKDDSDWNNSDWFNSDNESDADD